MKPPISCPAWDIQARTHPKAMLLGKLKRRAARWSQWMQAFFRLQVLDLRCTSVLGQRALNLQSRVLRAADEAQIAFMLRYPKTTIGAAPLLSIQLHFPGNTPSLGARSAGSPELSSQSPSAPMSPEGWLVEQSRGWRRSQVVVRVSHRILASQDSLEVSISHRHKLLDTLRVRVIDEAEAQRQRLAELRVVQQRLWIQSGEQAYPGEAVLEASGAFVAELTLAGSELHSVLPACEASLRLNLRAGKTQIDLGDTRVFLGNGPVRFRARPLAVSDYPVLQHPGRYRLAVTLCERELAVFPFRIGEKKEFQEQVKVIPLIEAETADGQRRRVGGALQWGKHFAFYPALRFQTALLAPNTPIKCLGRILQGETELYRQEIQVRLSKYSQWARLERFSLERLASLRGKHLSLLLTVDVENQPKAVRRVLILPSGGLANFEGQLSQDATSLTVDEEAYREILKNLTNPDPG